MSAFDCMSMVDGLAPGLSTYIHTVALQMGHLHAYRFCLSPQHAARGSRVDGGLGERASESNAMETVVQSLDEHHVSDHKFLSFLLLLAFEEYGGYMISMVNRFMPEMLVDRSSIGSCS
jgi:hypothetical protein